MKPRNVIIPILPMEKHKMTYSEPNGPRSCVDSKTKVPAARLAGRPLSCAAALCQRGASLHLTVEGLSQFLVLFLSSSRNRSLGERASLSSTDTHEFIHHAWGKFSKGVSTVQLGVWVPVKLSFLCPAHTPPPWSDRLQEHRELTFAIGFALCNT